MTTPDNDAATLFVPMQVDALVINEPIANGGATWNRWQMEYEKLNTFTPPMPEPSSDQVYAAPEVGVHIHWALPDGLTHGVGKPGDAPGEFTYPYLPNRWLIARVASSTDPATPGSVTAWVLVADAYTTAPGTGGAPFLDPYYTPTDRQPCQPVTLGKSMTLAEWDAAGGESGIPRVPPFLKALGPGNVTFAAYAPGNRNVLSFVDTLAAVDKAWLSYVVIGWYSQDAMDPLHSLTVDPLHPLDRRNDWQAYVDPDTGAADPTVMVARDLDWSVKLDGAAPPTVTTVVGFVHRVNWDRHTAVDMGDTYPRNISESVRVSVGNTTIDALAGLVREQALAAGVDRDHAILEADLLEAFLHEDLADLDVPGGEQRLDQKIRAAAYGQRSGGILWNIVPVERADTSTPPPAAETTPEQRAWLAELNTNQARLDAEREILASMQRRLADLWWKSRRILFVPEPDSYQREFDNAKRNLSGQIVPGRPDGYYQKVVAQQAKVAALAALVPVATGPESGDSIKLFTKGHLDPDQFGLKPNQAPRFAFASDPVMLITGLGRSERFGSDGILRCRTASQLVTGIAVRSTSVTTSSMSAGAVPQLTTSHLPGVVNAVLAEGFWLNPENAALIAREGLGSTDAATIAELRTDITAATNLVGLPPAASGSRMWQQPWLPLFLEWQVDFFYTFETDENGEFKTDALGNHIFDRTHWEFDGVGFAWTGREVNRQNFQPYEGRTFLTPHGSFTFLTRLEAYLQHHPNQDLQKVKDLLDKLSQWDVLSQTLSGLTARLAMIDPGANIPPPASVRNMVGSGAQDGVPYLGAVPTGDVSFGGGPPFFFPVRAGFLGINHLRISDSFGRTLSLLGANGNTGGTAASFCPIQGRGLAPDSTQVGPDAARLWLELPPRLAQPARLDFTWVSADNDAVAVEFQADTSPICGWLLPNHLDKSLGVYDAKGNALGELLTLFRSATTRELVWCPAPGNPAISPVVRPNLRPELENFHLNEIVSGLLDRDDAATAFNNFLQAIDETLWTVEPLGSRTDRHLTTLIGRPLAVTLANLQLRLAGLPYVNQAFFKTFTSPPSTTLLEETGSLLDLSWPVRLGYQELRDDGVVGYFTDGDYGEFNAVHLPDEMQPASPPYVKLVGPGNYLDLKFRPTRATSTEESPFDPSDSVYVTLLVDPNGVINAITGLLPDLVVELPADLVKSALDRMIVTFRTGPLLLDPEAVRLPMPAETKGVWSWIQPAGTEAGDWQTDPVSPAPATARLSERAVVLREGWLAFTPNKNLS